MTSQRACLAWALAQHQVLLRAVAQAAAMGLITHAWQIFECLSWFLGDQGYWADFQAVGQAVLAAAGAADDHAGLGWTHAVIGRYCRFTGADDDGRAHLSQALDHSGRPVTCPARPRRTFMPAFPG